MSNLTDFYDPESYEMNAGFAPRVDEVYAKAVTNLPAGSRIMELGCGIGNVLLPLARAGFATIGVDRSPAMLERFRQLAEAEATDVAARVRLERAELPALPAVEPVDAILLPNDLIAHILDDATLDELWHNIANVLRPGG